MSSLVLKVFCFGGVTFIIWPLLLCSEISGFVFAKEIKYSILSLIVFSAVFFYQPHFVSTYFFNYGRGKKSILQNSLHLIFAPVIILILLSGFYYWGRYNLLGVLYFLTLLWASWHFLKQTIAAIIDLDKSNPGINSNLKILFHVCLICFSCYGLIRMFDLHNGSVELFGLRTPLILIPLWIQKMSLLIALTSFIITFSYAIEMKLRWIAYLPFLAFIVWYTQDIFLGKYFYFIPVLHGIQHVPFYLKKMRTQTYWRLKTISITVASFFFVQLIPSLLGESYYLLFPTILIFFNLHHFVMEAITWKKIEVVNT